MNKSISKGAQPTPDSLSVHLCNQGGFTLIELLVAVGILAILWAVSPNYRDVVDSFRMTSTTNSFAGALKRARSEAMVRRVPVAVCASANAGAVGAICNGATWDAGWIIFPDVNGDQARAVGAAEPVIISTPARTGFTITDNFTGINVISFLPSGLLANVGAVAGTVTVCQTGNPRAGKGITLNSIGKARIAASACP